VRSRPHRKKLAVKKDRKKSAANFKKNRVHRAFQRGGREKKKEVPLKGMKVSLGRHSGTKLKVISKGDSVLRVFSKDSAT